MEAFKNRVETISREECGELAGELYDKMSGLAGKEGPKFDRLRQSSAEIRKQIDERIKTKLVYSFFDDVTLNANKLNVAGIEFSCNAFEQLDPRNLCGAYVYLLTAGDCRLDDAPILDQLLADFWGTAFVDAARLMFREQIEKGKHLSADFGPGFYGMPVTQMHGIEKLADAALIGVRINESSLLVPAKSCAGIILLGEAPFEEMDAACADCRGTVLSCNICNVKKAKEMKEAKCVAKEPIDFSCKKPTDFKCTGICPSCGRCKDAGIISGDDKRKAKLLSFPADFRPDTGESGYGIAFDIGTTTVAGTLMDLCTGKELGATAKTNPQNAHGLDVISRITYSEEADGNLRVLHDEIVSCMNDILSELCEKAHIKKNAVTRGVACGNTTMSHIFAGYPPSTLARTPFNPMYTGTLMLEGRKSGLDIADDGTLMLVPNIAAHVGGDITAGIIAARLFERKGLVLFIDIGTNGEIALSDGKRTLACSTAAGPAFEGAAIHQGMRAAKGAIERVQIRDEKLLFGTIENTEPMGICGSGLIDAVAEMLKFGLINNTGRIVTAKDMEGSKPAARLREGESGREFVLVFKENGEDIVITQKDIREVQLAKGAISAGISVMLGKLGKTVKDIDSVIVAGAFGNFIDKESAVAIGLLPKLDLEKIHLAGNAAGTGVVMALTSSQEADRIKNAASRVEHVELAEEADFQEKYLSAMSFA